MVYPGKKHKRYESPNHPWQQGRMNTEFELMKVYGLRNKKEVWKAESQLREYRSNAMKLLAQIASKKEVNLSTHLKKESLDILNRLIKYGILKNNSKIDDILGLKTENILERRLQTQVLKLGLSKTIKQARQFITHGHIAICGKKVTIPSVIVSVENEKNIDYYIKSPILDSNHKEHPNLKEKLYNNNETLKKINEQEKKNISKPLSSSKNNKNTKRR